MCEPSRAATGRHGNRTAGTTLYEWLSGSPVDRVEVSTVVHLPPEEVYEFIVDFPGYANYSEYLERVRSDGDGSPEPD